MRTVYEEGASKLKTDDYHDDKAQRKLLQQFITVLCLHDIEEWQEFVDNLTPDERTMVTDKNWSYVITVLYNSCILTAIGNATLHLHLSLHMKEMRLLLKHTAHMLRVMLKMNARRRCLMIQI